jgi:hypothetical protein
MSKINRNQLVTLAQQFGLSWTKSKTMSCDDVLAFIVKAGGTVEEELDRCHEHEAFAKDGKLCSLLLKAKAEKTKGKGPKKEAPMTKEHYDPMVEMKRLLAEQEKGTIVTTEELLTSTSPTEVKDVRTGKRFTLITGEEVNASEQVMMPGILVKLYKQGEGFIIRFEDGEVPIGIHAINRYGAATMKNEDGTNVFKLIRIQLIDPQLRIEATKQCISKLHDHGMEKYGRPLYPIFWHSDTKDMKGLVGFKEDFDKLLGVDIFAGKDPVKLIGYDTPTRIMVANCTKNSLRFLVVNPVGPNGEAYCDGQAYMNFEFKYIKWLSTKEKEAGKEAQWKKEDTMQFRCFSPLFMKGQQLLGWQYVHDICHSYNIENWQDYDGVVNLDVMKTNPNGLKHGDSFEVNPMDISIVNMITENPSSSAGVQLVTHKPSVVCALADEMGVAENGKTFRGILDGNLDDVYKMLMSSKVKSMEDSDIAPAMFLGMSVPNGKGSWRPLAIKSIRDREAARITKFYQTDVLKMQTSELALYSCATPVIIKDAKGNLRDCLSVFERYTLENDGNAVNYVILPDDIAFIRKWVAKKCRNSMRHPVVGIGSIQEDTNLPKYFVDELIQMGFKSIYTINVDGVDYAVHPAKHGILISYDRAIAQNGDFDGDMQYFIISDTAKFGVAKMPEITIDMEDTGKEIDAYNHNVYHKFLLYKYVQVINSQPLIGLVDLLVRRIIEENRLNNKGLSVAQYMKLALIRESMIQGRKHLTDDMDLDNPPSVDEVYKNISERLIRTYHWAGKMNPKGAAAPATHKLKVFGASGTGIRATSSFQAVQNIVELVPTAKRQPNYSLDPYSKGWDELIGAQYMYHNEDAVYWMTKFDTLWTALQKGNSTILGVEVSAKRIISVVSFCHYLVYGNSGKTWLGYTASARDLLSIRDENVQRQAFFDLNKQIDALVAGFVEEQCGLDPHRQDLLKKMLTIYLGKIGFGGRLGKGIYTLPDNGGIIGHSGGCFWRMKAKYIIWVAKLIHPNNPMLDRLIDDYNIKM